MNKVSGNGKHAFKNNLGRDLSFLSRDLSRGLMAKSAAKGHKGLKLNWDTVFLNLDFREGSRIVDLAQANGLTKQAMSQIVAEIEKQGYITKQEDPEDGRPAAGHQYPSSTGLAQYLFDFVKFRMLGDGHRL